MALHFETPENFQTMLIINILIMEIHGFISNRDFPILFLFENIKTQMREFISICMTSHFTFANQIQMIENIRFSSFFKLKYFFRRNLNWIKFISSFVNFVILILICLFTFTSSGWGKIKHPGSSHPILQQAMMPPIDNAKCKQRIQASGGM